MSKMSVFWWKMATLVILILVVEGLAKLLSLETNFNTTLIVLVFNHVIWQDIMKGEE